MSGATTKFNPYSWNSKSNILWIDQPGGTGFSYTDAGGRDTDEAGVARDMYAFLQAFFKAHVELQGRPFYVTGESYGESPAAVLEQRRQRLPQRPPHSATPHCAHLQVDTTCPRCPTSSSRTTRRCPRVTCGSTCKASRSATG